MEEILEIQKIVTGGMGLARLPDGMVCLVEQVLPGETVAVRVERLHRGFAQAVPVAVPRPSPQRTVPPCPWYAACGGCDLQIATYGEQLRIKDAIVKEALARAGVDLSDCQRASPLPSPQPFGYRHRVRLHLDSSGRLGFHGRASNQTVPIDGCQVAAEPINRSLAALSRADLRKVARWCNQLELLASPIDGQVFLLFHHSGSGAAAIPASLHAQADHLLMRRHRRLRPDDAPLLGQHFAIAGLSYTLRWRADSFFQANAAQNAALVQLVLQLAGELNGKTAIDLFCGMGNFAVPLALAGAAVTGVERNASAIRQAEANANSAGAASTRFVAGDVEQFLAAGHMDRADLIVLDPPRTGMAKGSRLLSRCQADKIIYVSCDPATLARDLRTLCEGGYRVDSLTPVDMFPQTHHIESVAVLEKN